MALLLCLGHKLHWKLSSPFNQCLLELKRLWSYTTEDGGNLALQQSLSQVQLCRKLYQTGGDQDLGSKNWVVTTRWWLGSLSDSACCETQCLGGSNLQQEEEKNRRLWNKSAAQKHVCYLLVSRVGSNVRRRSSRVVSSFAIILRVLGGGHGEINALCSSGEFQTAPGEDFVQWKVSSMCLK